MTSAINSSTDPCPGQSQVPPGTRQPSSPILGPPHKPFWRKFSPTAAYPQYTAAYRFWHIAELPPHQAAAMPQVFIFPDAVQEPQRPCLSRVLRRVCNSGPH